MGSLAWLKWRALITTRVGTRRPLEKYPCPGYVPSLRAPQTASRTERGAIETHLPNPGLNCSFFNDEERKDKTQRCKNKTNRPYIPIPAVSVADFTSGVLMTLPGSTRNRLCPVVTPGSCFRRLS